MTPRFIASEIYRRSRYGRKHPLSIPRVSTVVDLIRALGWLRPGQFLESPIAGPGELARFHDPAYVAVVQAAERDQALPADLRERHNLGRLENPIYEEVFSRPATAAGASILAARTTIDGGVVHSPAGGTHHGQPARASGFCYFNDPVLGLLTWLDLGLTRVLYVDLDAHHGDGVQDAFHDDDRVLTISIHEAGRWPMDRRADPLGDTPGGLADRAGGLARNLPVPAGMTDDEFDYLIGEAVLPLAQAFAPQALMIQAGADALEDDPLSRQGLSNNAYWRAVAALLPMAERVILLGGGGYNPWSVARAWAGNWGLVTGAGFPDRLPPAAEAILRGLHWNRRQGRNPPDHWFTTLVDTPRPGPIRDLVRHSVAQVMAPPLPAAA